MTARVVPIAYVTKYAETRGIIVVRGAKTGEGHYAEALNVKGHLYGPKDWTEDLAKAQHRHKANLRRYLHLALKRVKALQDKLTAPTAPMEDK